MDRSPPGSSVHGILQARTVEWLAVPSPGDLPDPGIEPQSPALQADSLLSEPPGKPLDRACYKRKSAELNRACRSEDGLQTLLVDRHLDQHLCNHWLTNPD